MRTPRAPLCAHGLTRRPSSGPDLAAAQLSPYLPVTAPDHAPVFTALDDVIARGQRVTGMDRSE